MVLQTSCPRRLVTVVSIVLFATARFRRKTPLPSISILVPKEKLCTSLLDYLYGMSAAASTSASPTVVRSHSSSRPHAHHRPPSSDLPHRTRSTTARPPSSYSHQHSSSRSQTYDRRPPSNQAAFANIARRDFENSNLARPSTSRRDSSRERSQERPLTSHRPDPARAPQHHSTASRHRRNSVDMPGTVVDANAANVAAAAASAQQAGHGNPNQPKRRTMISTPTGQWALGKTIGAGSMGKVKIAKNIETGEQVIIHFYYYQSNDRLSY